MLIDLAELQKKEEIQLAHLYPINTLDWQDDESKIVSDCSVTLTLRRRGREIDLRGQVETDVETFCDRCLVEVKIPVHTIFNLICLSIVNLSKTDEIILEKNELDFHFYENNQINLDDLVCEQIQLALPMSKLCQENCQGLCSECKQNRNLNACNCPNKSVDLRWQALTDLKKKLQ